MADFIISEDVKKHLAIMIANQKAAALSGNLVQFVASSHVDWSKGHKPVVVDFSKNTSANVVIKHNTVLLFINPPKQEYLTLRLHHDATPSAYSLVWGGGIDLASSEFIVGAVKWHHAGLTIFGATSEIWKAHFVFDLYKSSKGQTHPFYIGEWSTSAIDAPGVKADLMKAIMDAKESTAHVLNIKQQDAAYLELEKEIHEPFIPSTPLVPLTPSKPSVHSVLKDIMTQATAAKVDTQQVVGYSKGKVQKVKIKDITSEELQQQLVDSLKKTAVIQHAVQQQHVVPPPLDVTELSVEDFVKEQQQKASNDEAKLKAYQVKNLLEKVKAAKEDKIEKEKQAALNQMLAGMQPGPEKPPDTVPGIEPLSEAAKVAIKDMFKIDVRLSTCGVGVYKVFFHSRVPQHVDAQQLPSISLSKHPGNCWFRLDKLHEHDYHTSTFNGAEVKTYVKRVLIELQGLMLACKLATLDEMPEVDAIEFGDL